MAFDRKTRIVLNHIEAVRQDLERTIDQSESREHWRSLVRSVLMHWLSTLYDEGAGYTKDLETSVAIQRDQVAFLKKELTKKEKP